MVNERFSKKVQILLEIPEERRIAPGQIRFVLPQRYVLFGKDILLSAFCQKIHSLQQLINTQWPLNPYRSLISPIKKEIRIIKKTENTNPRLNLPTYSFYRISSSEVCTTTALPSWSILEENI